jgi:hypothetical protein
MKYIPLRERPRWGAGWLVLLTDRDEIERKLVVEDDIEEGAVPKSGAADEARRIGLEPDFMLSKL